MFAYLVQPELHLQNSYPAVESHHLTMQRKESHNLNSAPSPRALLFFKLICSTVLTYLCNDVQIDSQKDNEQCLWVTEKNVNCVQDLEDFLLLSAVKSIRNHHHSDLHSSKAIQAFDVRTEK